MFSKNKYEVCVSVPGNEPFITQGRCPIKINPNTYEIYSYRSLDVVRSLNSSNFVVIGQGMSFWAAQLLERAVLEYNFKNQKND